GDAAHETGRHGSFVPRPATAAATPWGTRREPAMIREPSEAAAQQHLHEVLVAYIEAVEAGLAPDRERLVADHPDLADYLREFFASHDQVNRLTAALRETARPPLPAAAPVGELGDFRLLREVGRGGMGVVYEAEQISLHR